MTSDSLGSLLVLSIVFAAGCVLSAARVPRALKIVLYAGIGLRIGGALIQYLVLTFAYRGVADSVTYYRNGLRWAEYFWRFDFSPFYDPALWRGGKWWGTQFVAFPSSIVTALIGPTMLGSFIVFSLLAFLGLLGFVVAYRRMQHGRPVTPYAAILLLFPSLWFWPATLGKEALALLGLGLTVAGVFGPGHRVRLLPLLAGFFLLVAVRVELAGVVAVALLASQWLSFETRWTTVSVMRAVVLAAVTLVVLRYSTSRMGIESLDVEGVASYIENEPARRLRGGSQVGAVSLNWAGAFMAPINVLFRPFPWEARNGLMLVSSLELSGFWLLAFCLRRRLFASLRLWRHDPLIRLSAAFVVLYAIALGMTLSNFGIIARQRIFLFPFLFVLLQRESVAVAAQRAMPRPGQHDELLPLPA